MRTDPARAIFHDDGTGIFVRAQTPEGRWISADMAELDRDSLIEFMRSRGPVSDWARDLLILTLGHDREGLTPTLCEHGNALGQCPFTACSHFGEPWNGAPL